MIDDRTKELVDEIVDRMIQHRFPEKLERLFLHIESQYKRNYEKGFTHGVSTK